MIKHALHMKCANNSVLSRTLLLAAELQHKVMHGVRALMDSSPESSAGIDQCVLCTLLSLLL